MNLRDYVASLVTALFLLVAAGLIQAYQVWSFLGNYTLGWFCSAVGIGLLLVVLTSALTGKSPAKIPGARVAVIVLGASAAVGLGMLLDGVSYASALPPDWPSSLAEWGAFTLILTILFWIPRIKDHRSAEPAAQPDGDHAAG